MTHDPQCTACVLTLRYTLSATDNTLLHDISSLDPILLHAVALRLSR